MHDIAAKPPKAKRKILDDDVYDAFEAIRKYIPRGVCIMQIEVQPQVTETHLVVFAMKKFVGAFGDDDDIADEMDENGEQEGAEQAKQRVDYYFSAPVSTTTTLFSSTKENGESSHLAPFFLQGKQYFVLGSKNTHLIIDKAEQIALYPESPYRVAKIIAEEFMKQLPSGINGLMEYMWKQKITATMEFLQVEHQHVEKFDFDKSQFRFITFTSNVHLEQMCLHDFLGSIAIAAKAGMQTVEVTKYAYKDQDDAFAKIRKTYGKEGAVVYYQDNKGDIIGMIKKKTIWYVLVRAIREKAKGFAMRAQKNSQENMSNAIPKLKAMIKQKREWLGFSLESGQKWYELSLSFFQWIEKNSSTIDLQQVSGNFPIVWNQFLNETKQHDKLPVD